MKSAGKDNIEHGGSLAKAEAAFAGAPKPWVDLSTGINPHAYPLLQLPATAWTRLPEPGDAERLQEIAAAAYGAPSAANIVAAPGTQIILPMIYGLRAAGEVAILGPTYEEHAHAAQLAGHRTQIAADLDALAPANIAVVVNPNNPTGRVVARADLMALAGTLDARGGLLIVDEAFMDVCSQGETMAGDVDAGNIVVLRSFGKFYGMAGVRLGFAVSSRTVAQNIRPQLGPWAVSGPALAHGIAALSDKPWQEAMRQRLAQEAGRLHDLLAATGGVVSGGANLYRHLRLADAQDLFTALGRRGIYVRAFADRPDELRFGLPAGETAWGRLEEALDAWRKAAERSAA